MMPLRSPVVTRVRDSIDWPLLVMISLIAVIGVVNLYSASSVAKGKLAEVYVQQIYWLVAGGILATFAAAIDYRHFERLAYLIYGVGIVLLLLVFILGRDIKGSHRWIDIGGDSGFRFQPSEFMKIILAVALAKYMHDDPKIPIGTTTGGRTLKDLVFPSILAGIPFALVAKQPDLGTALILMGVFLGIMSMAKVRVRSLLTLVVSFAVMAPLIWNYILHDYQKRRVTSFINPDIDIRGAAWHSYHARVAIGNGGVTGLGYMKGTQNHYLFIPEQHSDFPFPVYAEDWGLAGTVTLVILYTALVLWGIRIASRARDRFGAALAVGITSLIFFHTFFNIGMVTGVLPVVGVTLPLFSYGGSNVITVMVGIGLLMNISMRRNSIQ